MINRYKVVWLIAILALIQGCSVSAPRLAPVEDRSTNPSATTGNPQAAAPGTGPQTAAPLISSPLETHSRQDESPPAIIALLDDAEQAEASGNPEAAAATLERALKIDQNNALIWSRLAGVHMRRGDLQQALVMARKSNTLATGDYSLQLENWFLILAIRQQSGDAAGVAEARRKIEELRRQGAGVSG